MNRRGFLGVLGALPLAGLVKPEPPKPDDHFAQVGARVLSVAHEAHRKEWAWRVVYLYDSTSALVQHSDGSFRIHVQRGLK